MKKITFGCIVLLALVLSVTAFLLYNGYIWFNTPNLTEYPVRGIDISNHQGKIDWQELKKQNFAFVYIKATEGKDYRDKFFAENWISAKDTGLIRGAYHFFTFRSSGQEQAQNFIGLVPVEKGCLPPVIDMEFGGNSKEIPEKDKLQKELDDFIKRVEDEYKQEVIIYTTYEAYDKYLQDSYPEKKIWIRDIVKHPKFADNREWVLWQYCNRGRVTGISGFVDLNVFKGDKGGLERLLSK